MSSCAAAGCALFDAVAADCSSNRSGPSAFDQAKAIAPMAPRPSATMASIKSRAPIRRRRARRLAPASSPNSSSSTSSLGMSSGSNRLSITAFTVGWRCTGAMRCEAPEIFLRASAVRCRTTSGVHDLVLRLNCRFGPLGRCRFFNALHVRGKCRALLVFFLRTLGGDARRWLRWILNPSRRSFELSVLVNRQRAMKNVTLDRATVLQLDADGSDSALDAAADCHVLRNDAALDLRAIANQEI